MTSDDPIEIDEPLDINPELSQSIEKIDHRFDQHRIKKKDENSLKLVETVFDSKTRLILFSHITKGFFEELGGAISTGKEANVYYGFSKENRIAVKIFRIDSPSFRKMRPYVEGDHRFKRYKRSRSGFIEVWAKKEFKNLKRMSVHDIPVPRPIHVERNILLMEFLGTDDYALPRLKDQPLSNPVDLYKRILESVKIMYREAKLVHGDLSEFNILYNLEVDQFYIIDVSQAVLTSHPRAAEFLGRDLHNLNHYFGLLGVKVIEIGRVFRWITGIDIDEALLLTLSKD